VIRSALLSDLQMEQQVSIGIQGLLRIYRANDNNDGLACHRRRNWARMIVSALRPNISAGYSCRGLCCLDFKPKSCHLPISSRFSFLFQYRSKDFVTQESKCFKLPVGSTFGPYKGLGE
jgi:hypothetical protein